MHLIVEAESNEILTSGMRSLTVTFARGLKKGRVQLERYHLHVLRHLREAQNAVKYVLYNEQRHGGKFLDEFSSVITFWNKWKDFRELSEARTYLIRRALVT